MTRERFRPWSAEQLARLVLSQLTAFAVLVVVWWQTSGTGVVQRQLAWLGLGVVGLLVAGAGSALWLLRGLRRVQLAQQALHERIKPQPRAEPAPVRNGAPPRLVTGAAMTRYHLPDCALVADKATFAVSPGPDTPARRPCEVCRP